MKIKNFKISASPAVPLFWAALIVSLPASRLICTAAALVLHEAAHLCAMAALGVGAEGIRLTPAGIEIRRAGRLTSYAADACVSLPGPAVSLAAGAAALAFGWGPPFFAAASLALGAVNLLPVRGLDGGEALSAALSALLSPEKARAIVRPLSAAVSLAVWVAAVYVLLATSGNFSLFILSAALFCSSVFRE